MNRKSNQRNKLLVRMALVATLAACLAGMNACSESDCSLEGEPVVRFNFINSKTNASITLFDSLTVTALNTDTVLVNRDRQINHLSLPLNYTDTHTGFVLHYSRFLRDTIRLTHENTPFFISTDCGIRMFHQLTSVEHTQILIDSICLVNSEINDYEKENYRIYYTPDE